MPAAVAARTAAGVPKGPGGVVGRHLQTLTAAASATLGAAALTVPGLSAAQNAPGAAGRADEPIAVHLRDADSGNDGRFVGAARIEVRDRSLADRLRRARR